MNIEDFAAAIPMKMDYIIMDACLMGGIEVAYALKDKCDRIIFSQAEVMGDGLCEYDTMASRLLAGGSPDYMGFCEDSYQHYAAPGASEPYTTISMIDCTRLDGLADVCAGIFSSCRSQLAAVKPGQVQGYFRFNKHWFYDLEDIFVKAGVLNSVPRWTSASSTRQPLRRSYRFLSRLSAASACIFRPTEALP